MTRCIHGFESPERTCGECRARIARGWPIELERRSSPARSHREERPALVEVVDDSARRHSRPPTVEEMRETEEQPIREERESMEAEKVKCKKCGTPKPLTKEFFYENPSNKCGFDISRCKECRKAYDRNQRLARAGKVVKQEPDKKGESPVQTTTTETFLQKTACLDILTNL